MNYYIYYKKTKIRNTYQSAIREFEKRLSPYCKCNRIPVKTIEIPPNTNDSNNNFLFIIEGPSTYSSEEFAGKMKEDMTSGKTNQHIWIGFTKEDYNLFLSESDSSIELQKMSQTGFSLPTDTCLLMLYEQLYRGYTILQGKTYHK